MKYGFEREFFLQNVEGQFVLTPNSIPADECGYLAESRGEPHTDPVSAAFLLYAEEHSLTLKANAVGLMLANLNTAVLSFKLRRDALRLHGKNSYPTNRGNIYGIDYKPTDNVIRAGMHVHFSNQVQVTDLNIKGDRYTRFVNGFLDVPKIVLALDKAFKAEIKAAKRLPGFYEIKEHGFEYRSLPATTNPVDVAEVLKGLKL